jgi:peptidoglycan/xylan/chitin deacetylase (PgdA/CDA1 family)
MRGGNSFPSAAISLCCSFYDGYFHVWDLRRQPRRLRLISYLVPPASCLLPLILFLTYHRVLAKPHAKPEFYDIPAARLKEHLQRLGDSGFHPLTAEELVASQVPRGTSFILSFDDATEDHFQVVLPLLLQYKCRAIFFVPTAKLNRPGYLTNEAVNDMSRREQYIGLHSHEHRRMDRMSLPELRSQMRISREQIQTLTGSPSVLFAPPGGFTSPEVRAVALESGIRAIRTMRWGYNRRLDLSNLQCIPINSRTTEKAFQNIMELRGMNLTYTLKQTLKSILPAGLYQSLRDKL